MTGNGYSLKGEDMNKENRKEINSLSVVKDKYTFVYEWDEADWEALIDRYELDLEEAEEFGKAFLRVN